MGWNEVVHSFGKHLLLSGSLNMTAGDQLRPGLGIPIYKLEIAKNQIASPLTSAGGGWGEWLGQDRLKLSVTLLMVE